MYKEEYYEEEENVHYISDQDSTDDKPQVESIIKETSKKFENEKDFVRILLSEHFKDFRRKFFDRIRHTEKSIYQGIKKEIRNCLNPYRVYIKQNTEISDELKELYELLKGYYKETNFNNKFFINYFKNLEEMHKTKSKLVNMAPKDEIETLNDIERKVTIIRNLKHYLNTSIGDRIQINYDQKKEIFKNDYFIMMYKYLVIEEEDYSKMEEKELFDYLSNKKPSYKLRRPLNDFNTYNYLPILCKGYCQKEAQIFIDKFNKSLISHVEKTKCERCTIYKEKLSKINSQIKSLYLKTCIFSHNINEIMFHPLIFFTLSIYLPFYKKQFSQKPKEEIFDKVQENKVPKRFNNLKGYDLQNIYNPADTGMKKIYNLLLEYAKKKGIYGNCCYLSEYKTMPCKLVFEPNTLDFDMHMKKCPNYHSELERRRINKILENDICKDVIDDGKWKTDDDEIHCSKNDFCNKYHTRNELFFDEKNYRKLYPCSEAYYCEKGDLCPKKHAIDIKIEEIYLPLKNKAELEKELEKIIIKDEKMKEKLEKFSKAICKSCLNFIDGTLGRNLYQFPCSHVICSKCFDYYNSCPICGFKAKDENNSNIIFIKLDENIKINKKKKKKMQEKKESDDSEESSSDKGSDDDSSIDKKEDKKSEESSEESSSEDNSIKNDDDDDLKDYEQNNINQIDEDFDMSDAQFSESKNNVSKISMSEDKEKEEEKEDNGHIKKGKKRGKNVEMGNNGNRRNNNYYENDNNDYYYNSGRGRGRYRRGKRGFWRGERGRFKPRGRSNYFNNNYSNQWGEDYQNEDFESSKYGRGNEKKREGNRGEKGSSYYESEGNENEKEDSSKLSNSNYEKEDDEDQKNYNYQEQFSMRKEKRNIRGHKRSGGIKINNDSSDNEEDF